MWHNILRRANYPEVVVVLDWETFWDKDYSLKKMSTIQYVCDSRFEIIGLGIENIGQTKPTFFPPDKTEDFINQVNWNNTTLVGQNLRFDCSILSRHFGVLPKYTVDIIDLDRIWDARDRHNLAYLGKKWKAPKFKGNTDLFKGLHWADMDAAKRQELEEYAKGDVEIESFLFQKLLPLVPNPHIELPLATQTLHLYLKPQIEIDLELGEKIKEHMLEEMITTIEKTGVTKSEISGNKSFVELLNAELPEDEQVPMKMGKNGQIPALAREDEGMRYLLGHEREKVRLLAAARLAVKSWPLHIKRVQNLMDQAACSGGKIGAPLSYAAAHTLRWGGTEGINLQNLGGRGRGKPIHPLIGQVRQMLKAPNGFVFGVGDFAQIEARVLAWLAGQKDLIRMFAEGGNPYADLASTVFQEPIRKPADSDPEDVHRDLAVKYGFGKDGILGCGYGMGTSKFYARCRENETLRPLFDSGEYDFNFIDRLIKTYRTKYAKIPTFWDRVEKAWRFVTKYPKESVTHPTAPLEFLHKDKATFINLPSGRFIRYPFANVNKQGRCQYRWGKLWGGSITENIVQAVARDILAEALLRLQNAGYNVLLTVHDEIICLFPKSSADLWLAGMEKLVVQPPVWAEGLPIAVDMKLCERYEK